MGLDLCAYSSSDTPNSVVGHGEPVKIPPAAREVDFEAELAVVIGKPATRVTEENALSHVAGYMCANDVSARDLQFGNSGQWMRGKAIDAFLPCGPHLVTADSSHSSP